MGSAEDQVFGRIDPPSFIFGVIAPEEEGESRTICTELLDDLVGQGLPAQMLMRCGSAIDYGEGVIEQLYALLGPACEVGRSKRGTFLAEISVDFFEDISQRGRSDNPLGNREGQAVSLTGSMIGILSEYDYFDLVKRGKFECAEDLVLGWKNALGLPEFGDMF